MGLIPGFEHDVFLSYCWDDEVSSSDTEGWIFEFQHELEHTLNEALRREVRDTGRKVSVFIDKTRLAKDQPLTRELQERVEASATFLIMMSSNYLASVNCRKELGWFSGKMNTGGSLLKFDAKLYPLLIALLRPTDHRTYPPELATCGVGYKFFKDDYNNNDPRFCYPSIRTIKKDIEPFQFTLGELKGALAGKFGRALEIEANGSRTIRASSPATSALAVNRRMCAVAVTPDQSHVVDKLRARLGEASIELVRLDPAAVETKHGEAEAILSKASAAALLLGFPGSNKDTALLQLTLDAARQRELPLFGCLSPNLRPLVAALPDDPYGAYKTFIAASADDTKWGNADELADALLARLTSKVALLGEEPSVIEIYIDNDRENRNDAEEVARFLREQGVQALLSQHNIEVISYLPTEREASQPDYNMKRREHVARCNGAVIVFRNVPVDTVVFKAKDMLKVVTQKRKAEFRIAVHDGPPPQGFGLQHGLLRTIENTSDESYLQAIVKFVVDVANAKNVSSIPAT